MPKWTFLTNHALVFGLLARRSLITGTEISSRIGITERAVRRIIAELDQAGYIMKQKEGRQVRYKINPHMPSVPIMMRHQPK